MSIEEAKAGLRLEETDAEADQCKACATARTASNDPTTYCADHLSKIYGV